MNDHKSREENTFDLLLCTLQILLHRDRSYVPIYSCSRALMKGGVGQFFSVP